MKKLLLVAAGLLILAILGYMTAELFTSHETRIRRLLAGMEEGFNAGDAIALCSGLAADFQELDSGLGREEVVRILYSIFHQERLAGGFFPHQAEILEDAGDGGQLEITVEKNPDTGEVTGLVKAPVQFYHKVFKDGKLTGKSPAAAIEFEGRLIREGGRWKIHKARQKILSGRMPF